MTLRTRYQVHRGSHATLANARAEWTERKSVLFEVSDGVTAGTGEASPLPGHSVESLADVVDELATLSLDPLAEVAPGLGEGAAWLEAVPGLPTSASARFAVETALLDYWGRRLSLPSWRFLTHEPVARSLTPSVVLDPLAEGLVARVERALGAGFGTVKLKVGRDALREAEAIALVRARFPRSVLRLRLDANRAWTSTEATRNLKRFARLDIELVEEPCKDAWPALSSRELSWALDESLLGVTPSRALLEHLRPAAIVLKPMLLGGFARCLEWAAVARELGVSVIVSHFFDGPIGLAATTQLAFAAQSSDLAAGLGPHAALSGWDGLCAAPTFVTARSLALPTGAGHGVIPATSDDDALSVFAAARACPAQVALVLGERSLTFSELAHAVTPRLRELEASGAVQAAQRSGRPLAVVAELTLDALSWLYACIEARIPCLPLHPRFSEVERAKLIERTRPAAVIDGDTVSLRDLDAQDATSAAEPELAWLMTSGSSGAPKAVRSSRRAFLAAARASEENLGWLEEDRWLLSIPWAHVGGLSVLVRCLVARRAVVLDEKLPPLEWARFLEERRVTLLSLVPTQLSRLLETPSFHLPESVRAVLLGGAPATPSLLRAAGARRMPILPTYGLTETCAQVATARYSELKSGTPRVLGLVGPPLSGVELRLDADGTISVRGPTLFSGYADEPSPLVDGWFTTSDWGELTEQGVRVHGRRDNVILTGGENVSAEAVEAMLIEHPAIASVCVVGVPDPQWGELVTAVVQLRAGAGQGGREGLEAVIAWARENLSGIVRPKAWLVRDSLPLLPSGKLDRTAIARDARGSVVSAEALRSPGQSPRAR